MAIAEMNRRTLSAEEFLQELDDLRAQFLKGRLLRPTRTYESKEQVADVKRRRHLGGNVHNHKFVGEKYLRSEDKEVRRMNLRKLVDECGQTAVGTGLPSHPTLARWGSYEFGLTDEEIDRLEKEDLPPESAMWQTTKVGLHRESSWPITIAMSLVGEGEKLKPEIQQKLQDEIRELRRTYASLGIENLDRALAFETEHAGVDVDHAEIAVTVLRKFINTPELQDEMRRAYILTLQQGLA
jgi:pyrroloquinoline quinone (PQQ) biosynthesis protein C